MDNVFISYLISSVIFLQIVFSFRYVPYLIDIIVYLDNILIFTQILEEYYRAVYRIIEVLAEHKLFLCSKKYML